jgi:hypothetical protein
MTEASALADQIEKADRVAVTEEVFTPHDLFFAYRRQQVELDRAERALIVRALRGACQ